MQTTILIDSTETALSRSDRAAVEGGIGLSLGSNVYACCPNANEGAIRYAIAAGAGKLVSLDQIEAGLVVCGLGGLGFDGELTAARIANRHQGQLVLDVLSFSKQGDRLEVFRKLDRGEMEVLLIALPAVLVMSESANTIQYLSRYRQAAVSMPEVELRRASAPAIQWEATRPRTKTAELSNKTGGGAHQRMFATFGIDNVSAGMGSSDDGEIINDPEDCAVQLVRYLAHHGFIDSKLNEPAKIADLTQGRERLSPGLQSKQSSASATHTAGKFSAGLNRHAPRPMQLTPCTFRAKRIRQPRSMDRPGFGKPMKDQLTRARIRRRPRPVDQSEPTNQRGPIPFTRQNNSN